MKTIKTTIVPEYKVRDDAKRAANGKPNKIRVRPTDAPKEKKFYVPKVKDIVHLTKEQLASLKEQIAFRRNLYQEMQQTGNLNHSFPGYHGYSEDQIPFNGKLITKVEFDNIKAENAKKLVKGNYQWPGFGDKRKKIIPKSTTRLTKADSKAIQAREKATIAANIAAMPVSTRATRIADRTKKTEKMESTPHKNAIEALFRAMKLQKAEEAKKEKADKFTYIVEHMRPYEDNPNKTHPFKTEYITAVDDTQAEIIGKEILQKVDPTTSGLTIRKKDADKSDLKYLHNFDYKAAA